MTIRCEAVPTQISEKADSYKLLETAFEDYRRAPPSEVNAMQYSSTKFTAIDLVLYFG